MAIEEVIFAAYIGVLYITTFLTFSTLGNILVGHRSGDLLYPFSKDFGSHFGTKDRPTTLYYLYYLTFFGVLALISLQVMMLQNSIKAWIDKMLGGGAEAGSNQVSPMTSSTSVSGSAHPANKGNASSSGSDTSVGKKKKKKLVKKVSTEEVSKINQLKSGKGKPKGKGKTPVTTDESETDEMKPRMSQVKPRPSFKLDKPKDPESPVYNGL